MPPKKSTASLGRAIIKDRFRGMHQRNADGSLLHTTELFEGYEKDMRSITEEGDLDAFLRTAELAGTEFTAEKMNVRILGVANTQVNPFLLSAERERELKLKHEEFKDKLSIPRRPAWTYDMSAEELDRQERDAFLDWRRQLALFQESSDILMTPYEKNIQVWRQLWRVVERSQLVVQIVDARDPLFYRCSDLDLYVKEVDSRKDTLLLVNKADLLTERQRQIWADYFKENGIAHLFFSAAEESAKLEEEEKEGEREVVERPFEDYGPSDVLDVHALEATLRRRCPVDDDAKSNKMVVGLVGYPNVGKSSTINALLGAKKVAVASTPGKTKHFQTLNLSDDLCLCDCPGLVFPNFAVTQAEMICNGVLPIDQMREYTGPAALVAQRIPVHILEGIYGIRIVLRDEEEGGTGVPTAEELLIPYAVARGFFRAGQGNPDEARAARYILKDYVNGKLLYCHPPPNSISGAEFNADVYKEASAALAQLSFKKTTGLTKQAQAHNPVSDIPIAADEAYAVRTTGKLPSTNFQRTQLYPSQVMIGNDGRPLSKDQIAASALLPSKKSHKKGQSRK